MLQPAGSITCEDGREYLSYQCGECLQTIEMFGEVIEDAPFTFCVGPDSKPFDPAAGGPSSN
jgi:hypothetical protein